MNCWNVFQAMIDQSVGNSMASLNSALRASVTDIHKHIGNLNGTVLDKIGKLTDRTDHADQDREKATQEYRSNPGWAAGHIRSGNCHACHTGISVEHVETGR